MACIPSPNISSAQSQAFGAAKAAINSLAPSEMQELMGNVGVGTSLEDVVNIGQTVGNPQQLISGTLDSYYRGVLGTAFNTQKATFSTIFSDAQGVIPNDILDNTLPLDAIEAKRQVSELKEKATAFSDASLQVLVERLEEKTDGLQQGAFDSLGFSLQDVTLANIQDPRQATAVLNDIKNQSRKQATNILLNASDRFVHPTLQDPFRATLSQLERGGFGHANFDTAYGAIDVNANEANTILQSIHQRVQRLVNLRKITPEQAIDILQTQTGVARKINEVVAQISPYRDSLQKAKEIYQRIQTTNMEQVARQTLDRVQQVAEQRIMTTLNRVLDAASIQVECNG